MVREKTGYSTARTNSMKAATSRANSASVARIDLKLRVVIIAVVPLVRKRSSRALASSTHSTLIAALKTKVAVFANTTKEHSSTTCLLAQIVETT
jgi:hypothetical protein